MATFKVGQRVKKIGYATHAHKSPVAVPLGAEATVTQIWRDGDICVLYDGYRNDGWNGVFCEPPHCLAPLTDPAADVFIERIKNTKPYEEPVAPKRVIA